MRRGDFATAWSISDGVLAQRRMRAEDCSGWPRHLQFIWNGSPVDDARVLVRCYHGLGDTLQYVRLLEPLHQRARKITLWAQPPLLGLLRHVRGIDTLLPLHDGDPGFDCDVDIELMEVAHLLRITLDDLPGRVPYVDIPASAKASADAEPLRVGIAWRSGEWDCRRSIPSEALQPLASVAGVRFFSLQFPPAPLPFPACDFACRDLERMAARMRALDLVISVDTMCAHLAGALGAATWLLLHERADWRWLEARADSPWYPTMRLFRRRTDWRALLSEVADALGEARDAATAARCMRSDGCRASSD